MRYLKYAGWAALGLGAVLCLFFLWSMSYAASTWFVGHEKKLWTRFFAGDVFLPIAQAWTWWPLPVVVRLVKLATVGMIGEVLTIGMAGLALAVKPWKEQPPPGGARFATLRDLKKAGMLDGAPGETLLLGTFKGFEVRYSGDSHFYVNGPSRSGKGRGFIMPNLLEWRGSAIVLDVKRENLEKTGAARLALGQKVFELAPGSEHSHRWNPLDFVRPWPARATDLQNVAAMLIPSPERGEAIWAQTARDLFASMLGYVCDSETMAGRRNLRSVLRMFNEGDLAAVFTGILARGEPLNGFILDGFRRHIARDPEQRPSFEGNVTTALKAWNNSLIADLTSASDFDIGELRRRPFTVFISAPVSDFGSVEPMIRLFIQQVHDVLLRKLPGKDEPHKVVLMLDEFYQFQKLPEIVNRAPLVAGYGFRIALVAQNIPQVDERYSRATREALLGNMDIKLVVAVGDKATGEVIADSLGKHFVERHSWGSNPSKGPFGGGTSKTGRWEEAPLMAADQLMRLDDRKTVLTMRGHFSAVLDKLNFYTDKKFLNRLAEVDHLTAMLNTPALLTVEEWPLFKNPPAQLMTALKRGGYFGQAWNCRPAPANGSYVVPNNIVALARIVFVNWRQFISFWVKPALEARSGEEALELLKLLKTNPGTVGVLRSAQGFHGRAARKRALRIAKDLLVAILAERKALDDALLREETAKAKKAGIGLQVERTSEPDDGAAIEAPRAAQESIITLCETVSDNLGSAEAKAAISRLNKAREDVDLGEQDETPRKRRGRRLTR
jgi:type IV secretion system protein VirD4